MSITRRKLLVGGLATAAISLVPAKWFTDPAYAEMRRQHHAGPLMSPGYPPFFRLESSNTYWYLTWGGPTTQGPTNPSDSYTYIHTYGYTLSPATNTFDEDETSTEDSGGTPLTPLYSLLNSTTGDAFYTTSSTVVTTYKNNGYSNNPFLGPVAGQMGWVGTAANSLYTAIYNAYDASTYQNCFGTLSQINALSSSWTKYTTTPAFYCYT